MERLALMADERAEDAEDRAAACLRESRFKHARRAHHEAIAKVNADRAADWRKIAAIIGAGRPQEDDNGR